MPSCYSPQVYFRSDEHPSYGRAEYQEILERFRKDGFIVVSEKRPANIDEKIYAGNLVGQIDSLLRAGIDPVNITVVGTSKGVYIDLSTQPRFKHSHLGGFKEIVLHTNLHHGFLFKALDVWIVPTEHWARFETD